MFVHVRYKSLYISSAQQHEMTKVLRILEKANDSGCFCSLIWNEMLALPTEPEQVPRSTGEMNR